MSQIPLDLSFLYWFYLHFYVLNCFTHLNSLFCLFIDFIKGVPHFLFKDLCNVHKCYLESFSHASALLQYSGPDVEGLLYCSGGVLPWLYWSCFMLTCNWEDCNSRYWCLVSSLLFKYFFLSFCCPLWFLEGYFGCVLPGKKFWVPDSCGLWWL